METIGKYTHLEKVGRGAMGVVYRAYDAFLDRTVAIKMMTADLHAEPHFRNRFFREARVAVQLEHANIVKIHDLAEEDGRAYIVMEFLDGEDLHDLIKRGGLVPLERRLDIMKQMAAALAYAHRAEVVHRDIKPGNIQITENGQVKILDFGLALITDSTMTATGAVLGTPSYMSPEQVGGKRADHRSDIFSVGTVFYELLTGHRAFTGETITEVFNKICNEDPAPIHEVNTLLPEGLAAVIAKSMAKSQEERYQSMDELVADVESFEESLAEIRHELRQEAEASLRRLKRLHEEHAQLLARPGHVENPEATVRFDLLEVDELSETETLALDAALPDGYLELHAAINLTAGEYGRTEALVEKLQWVADRAARPIEDESEKEIRRLANRIDSILSDYPGHPGAEDLRGRLLGELQRRQREQRLAELMKVAHEKYERGEPEATLKALDEALRLDPDNQAALSLRESVDRELEEKRQREERAREAAEALAGAREALAANSVVTARAEAERALAIDPEAEGAAELLEEVVRLEEEIRERRQRQQDIEGLLSDARELADASREEEAIQRLDELLEVEPDSETAVLLRGEIERRIAIREEERRKQEGARFQREREAALRQEQEARERQARIEEKLGQASEAMEAGEIEQVLELAAAVLEEDPDQPDARVFRDQARAALAEMRQQTAEAIKLTEELERQISSDESRVGAASQATAPRGGSRRLLAAAAVVVVALLAWALWPSAEEAVDPVDTPTVVTPTTGTLVVDASPWGWVVSIVDADGNAVALFDDSGNAVAPGEEVATPLSLEVLPGAYTVQLRHPDSDETRDVIVEIELGRIGTAFEPFEILGAEVYFSGLEW